MAVMAPQHVSIDRLAHAHLIRETFARSPLFRDAAVSEPVVTSAGEVALRVRFDGGPLFSESSRAPKIGRMRYSSNWPGPWLTPRNVTGLAAKGACVRTPAAGSRDKESTRTLRPGNE